MKNQKDSLFLFIPETGEIRGGDNKLFPGFGAKLRLGLMPLTSARQHALGKGHTGYLSAYLDKYARHASRDLKAMGDKWISDELQRLHKELPNDQKTLDNLFNGHLPRGISSDNIGLLEKQVKFRALFNENIRRQLTAKSIPELMLILKDKLDGISTHLNRFEEVLGKILPLRPKSTPAETKRLSQLNEALMGHYYPLRFKIAEYNAVLERLQRAHGEKKAAELAGKWHINISPIRERVTEAHKKAFGNPHFFK